MGLHELFPNGTVVACCQGISQDRFSQQHLPLTSDCCLCSGLATSFDATHESLDLLLRKADVKECWIDMKNSFY